MIFWNDVHFCGATVNVIFEDANGRQVMKYGYYLVIIDGCHRHAAVGILCQTGKHPWTAEHLQTLLIMG